MRNRILVRALTVLLVILALPVFLWVIGMSTMMAGMGGWMMGGGFGMLWLFAAIVVVTALILALLDQIARA